VPTRSSKHKADSSLALDTSSHRGVHGFGFFVAGIATLDLELDEEGLLTLDHIQPFVLCPSAKEEYSQAALLFRCRGE
jgi:hypothetical protein